MNSLSHLVLEDSYVLGIVIKPYHVTFRIDFVLTPEHPDYSPPSPGENECYRRGTLRIADFRTVSWRAANLKPSVDAIGEKDYGHVDQSSFEGDLISLRGDWGDIDVVGGTLHVSFDE
jgi:hypothetical protein